MQIGPLHIEQPRSADDPSKFIPQRKPLRLQLAARKPLAHISSCAMPALQQPFAGQPLINPQNRVLIDRQFASQFSHARQPIPRPQVAASALRANLIDNLPSDWNARRWFDAKLQVITDI